MIPARYLVQPLPDALQTLADLAMDLRRRSDREADEPWRTIDPHLWDATGNPWPDLSTTSTRCLDALARGATAPDLLAALPLHERSSWGTRSVGNRSDLWRA